VSKNLDKVIQRAISDAAFRRQLQANPQAALRGFKLTDDEVAALRSGDAGKLGSLGIDQRMSKAFVAFGAMGQASRSAGDAVLSVGGTRIADTGGANIGSADVAGGTNVRSADVAGGTNVRNADLDPGNASGSRSFGDPNLSGQAPSSDAIEDQSHAFSASRSADLEGTVRSAVRDVAPGTLQGSGLVAPVDGSPEAFAFQDTSRAMDADAIEDQSHAFSAGRSADVNAMGVATDDGQLTANTQPTDSTGLSDNIAASAAGRQGSLGTGGETGFTSRIRDLDTPDTGRVAAGDATGGVSRIRDLDTPDSSAAASGDATGAASRIRDLDTPDTTGVASSDVGGVSRIRDLDTPDTSAVSSSDVGGVSRIRDLDTPDTSAVSSSDVGGVSRIRDLDTPDSSAVASGDTSASSAMIDPDSADAYAPAFHTGGVQGAPGTDALEDMSHSIAASQDASLAAPSSDALEDMSHSIAANQDAFLSGEEATKYVTDPNLSSDQAEDISHSFNPDATTALPDHGAGDAIGNTGTNDPNLSA
jgi:hypothetical protein